MELRHILLSGKSPSSTPIPKSMLPVDTSKPPLTILRKDTRKECSTVNVIDDNMISTNKSSAIPTSDPIDPPVVIDIQNDVTSLPDAVTAVLKDVVPVTSDASHTGVHPITDTLVSCAPLVVHDRESSVSNHDVIEVTDTSDEMIEIDHITPVSIGTISVSSIVNKSSVVIGTGSVDLTTKSVNIITGTDNDVTIGSFQDCTVPDVNKDESTLDPSKNVTPPSPKLYSLSPTWHTKIPVNNCKKRPAQSPLMGKFLSGRRRLNTPVSKFQARNLFPGNDADSSLDSDDESFCWDRDSIASEILICEDFEGVVANNIDI